ncbi:MAG TPA: translocation/assembly module TamB domain-containing protein, partial [bacterium]|nr:translocation/assembly module TamB domain-containing protein [bacterium]
DGKIDVKDFSLSGDETDFHLAGREDGDGNLSFTARGELDLAFYSLFDSWNVFTRLEGVLNVASLVINGTSRDPIISGQANLERAAFKARAFPQVVDEVHGVIRFSQDEVVFEPSVTGKFGGGAFEGDGTLRLKGFSVRSWDLHARLADAKLSFPALTARVSGPLDFTGLAEGKNRPLLSGRLDASEVRFTQSFDWKAKAFNFAKSHDVLVAPDEQSKLFDLDITVTANDNVVMKNELTPNGVELRTVPDEPLEILGNNVLWYLGGSLELVRAGRVANRATFQDHVFDITSARVDFQRQKETFDFHYDVRAETVVRDWTLGAHISGNYLGVPDYEFDSNPPLAQEDINMLLVAGFTRQEAPDKEGAALAGILASVAGPGIADQSQLGRLKKAIPLDSFDVVPSYSQGGQVGLKVQGRKQLTPNLELQGDFLLGNNGRGKVLLDYRVNKTLHLEGGWNNEDRREGVDQNVQTQGDVGADAKFRFEWK